MRNSILFLMRALLFVLACLPALAANYPDPVQDDFIVHDFKFANGQSLPQLKIHYTTVGKPIKDSAGIVRNAVIINHGTGGAGTSFLSPTFADILFSPGGILDATKYFIILPDGLGHGKSSKPSDGLHLKFPNYGYEDMVRLEYKLVTEKLGINHMRLVMGTSMGAMHAWMWGYMYPDFMDALMPLASAPIEIAGRNRIMREMISQSIRTDPDFNNGDYTKPLRGMLGAEFALFMMTSSPMQLLKQAPTGDQANKMFDTRFIQQRPPRPDPNDMLYTFEASRDYNPNAHLEEIKAPLYAVNSADDLVNPPELGILEREIKRVPRGRYILIPASDQTRGHGTHSLPAVWGQHLAALLKESEPEKQSPAVWHARIETTKGSFVMEVRRDLAPHAADRFYHLIESGYYNDSRFFRVVPGRFAQFGIAGKPELARAWRDVRIAADSEKASNERGSFGFSMVMPDARSTQIYICTSDSMKSQDGTGFAIFGHIVEGMDVVDKLYSGYSETSAGGMRAGHQDKLFEEGNTYLDREFPRLDRLISARVAQ
jgi:homoserine O-acetyltransferase